MQTDQSWHLEYYALILREQSPAVWAIHSGSGWTLPRLSLRHDSRWHRTAQVVPQLEALVSVPLRFLFQPYSAEDEASGQQINALVLQIAGSEEPAGAGAWLTMADVESLDAPAAVRQVLYACLHELETGVIPSLRAPWARPGWYERMIAWVEQELDRSGHSQQGPPEMVRSWGLSYLLRFPTDRGDVYFKAVSMQPLFVNEPVFTARLAHLFPGLVPQPIAINAEQRWMLLPDVGEMVGFDAPLNELRDMLTIFARLQIDSVPHVQTLLAAGGIDRRLPVLAGQVDPLFAHPEVAGALSEAELARLQQLAGVLKASCKRLATLGIPHTIGHGDFHGSNVARRNGAYFIIDWTDGCIMHPFLDVIPIQYHEPADEQQLLWNHYLALWQEFAPLPRLLEALQLARPLMCLHQAISYQFILDNLEPWARADLAWGPPYWLRKLLSFIEE
jgi:hypothetical protein